MSFLAATYSSILLHGDVVLVVSVTSAVEQDGADQVVLTINAIYKDSKINTPHCPMEITPFRAPFAQWE